MHIRSSILRRASAAVSLVTFMILAWSGAALAQETAPAQMQAGPTKQTPVTLPRCEKEGQKIAVKIMTGVDLSNNGSLLPGTVDSHWVVAGPSVGPNTYATNKIPPWLTPTAPAMWIQPSKAGNPDSSLPAGLYKYKLLFNTPADPYLYTSFTITGAIAADNTITSVKLDGQPFLPLPSCANCFAAAITQTLGPVNPLMMSPNSPHVLEIDVNNAGAYSGLYVNLIATAVCSRCTMPRPPYHQVSGLPSRQLSLLARKQAPSC